MKRRILHFALGSLMLARLAGAMTLEERQAYLKKFLEITPNVATFNQWVERTGALPPDFDSLPKINGLPDPLLFVDGKRVVRTADDWKERRAEIQKYFELYDVGSIPAKPKLDNAVVVSETQGDGYFTRVVRLEYGPDSKLTTQITLSVPNGPGPFPVLMGGTAGPLVRRGYINCAFPNSVDAPPPVAAAYPEYDFASMGQVAWTVHAIVDYLYTVPQVDKPHIAITGYSRTGKMAAIAAMIDERITAVIAGSTGVGGTLSWRSSGESRFGEGIESTTRSFPIWFAKQLRFFAGREDRLPIDGNLLVASIAPRAILQIYGLNDEVSNSYGNEQSYYSAQRIYKLLGVPERNGILRVPGFHGANDLQASLDWLDYQFGRTTKAWQNNYLFAWDFDKWNLDNKGTVDLNSFATHSGSESLAAFVSVVDWEKRAADVRKSVQWMLGDQPPIVAVAPRGALGGARGTVPAGRGRGAGAAATNAVAPPATEAVASQAIEAAIVSLNAALATLNTNRISANATLNTNGLAGTTNAAAARGAVAGRGAAPAAAPRGAVGARGAATGPNPAQLGPDVIAWVIQRGTSFGWLEPQKSLTESKSMNFGDGVRGDLYYPAGTAADAKLPTVIWLHGYGYPLGYMWVYRSNPDLHPILALVRAGYAVLAFDQTGHGSRMGEFGPFYNRYPHWSRMGRMVEDTRAGIDALQRDTMVDPDRIYLYGYSMGGMLGLHVAALDQRVKGVVAINGFTPMRTDTMDRGTGGLARFSVDLPLMPRLAAFIGNEAKLPYDYNELIASIAPRPVYILQSELDRDATPVEVHAAVEQAKKIYTLYNAADKLVLDEPWDYNRLPEAQQDRIVQWMGTAMRSNDCCN